MRAAFGLLTALPLAWDPEDVAAGWVWTPAVGLALGVGWLVFHQAFLRVGGPFVAAAGVLLVHLALTGARPVRGRAGVVGRAVADPRGAARRGLPDVAGAGAATVALVLLAMSGFVILLDTTPAALVLVPLVGRVVQALLLGESDTGVGVPAATPGQRAALVVGALAALAVPPLLATAVRPERTALSVPGYLLAGVAALVVAALLGLLARAWLRARFGGLDPNGWHALGAVADLAALAAVVRAVS